MKKLLIYSSALLMAGLASCSQDDYLARESADGNVTFKIQLQDKASTRAIGDGLSAVNLSYAVYDNTSSWAGPQFIAEGTARFDAQSLSTTLTLDLAKGQTYNIVFFASYGSNVYTFDAENKTVSVNYANMSTSSKFKYDYDCFYTVENVEVGSSPVMRQVTLTRPVAQLNWGTSDYDNEYVQKVYGTSLRTGLKTKAYSTLNLLDGTVADEVEVSVKTPYEPIGEQYGIFPVDGYKYLNTMYLLVPQESSLIDCELVFYRSSTQKASLPVTNVPVERNFRTNIYGKLLTSSTEFEITKDPIYDGIHDFEIWDGTAGTLPEPVDGVYTISTASQLAAVAKAVNSGNSMSGMTVKLGRDIDLNNKAWTPIGKSEQTQFSGNFDGAGYTIKNLNVNLKGKDTAVAGLFGYNWGNSSEFMNVNFENVTIDVTNATGNKQGAGALIGCAASKSISNVTVSNVTITGHHYAGGVAGFYYGNMSGNHAENVTINLSMKQLDNGKYDYADKAGGICGYVGEGSYKLDNNSVDNVKITGFRDCGGLFGMLQNNTSYSGNTSNNVEIFVTLEHSDNQDDPAESANFGGIVGRTGNNVTDGGNNVISGYTLYQSNNVSNVTELAAALTKGGEVMVSESIDLSGTTSSITLDKPTTINVAAGKKLTVNTNVLENHSELTLKGDGIYEYGVLGDAKAGYEDSYTCLVINGADGKLTIDGGTYRNLNSRDASKGPRDMAIFNEGDLVINGGSFECQTGAALQCNYQGFDYSTNTPLPRKNVEINGGTFTTSKNGMYAVSISGHYDVTVNGGTFIGVFGCFRIEGGSATGAYPTNSNVVINGGTFLSTGSYYALAVNAESFGGGAHKVTIRGGKFWANNNTFWCRTSNGASITLEGGLFKAINFDGVTVSPKATQSEVNISETVSAGGMTANPTYKVSIK